VGRLEWALGVGDISCPGSAELLAVLAVARRSWDWRLPPLGDSAVRQAKAPVRYRQAAPQPVWLAKHLGKMPVLPLQRPSSQSSFTGKTQRSRMSPGPHE